VVDLAGKNHSPARAPQQLSDCLQTMDRTGQFLSDDREANLDHGVIDQGVIEKDFITASA
jgi:hypothetical protein